MAQKIQIASMADVLSLLRNNFRLDYKHPERPYFDPVYKGHFVYDFTNEKKNSIFEYRGSLVWGKDGFSRGLKGLVKGRLQNPATEVEKIVSFICENVESQTLNFAGARGIPDINDVNLAQTVPEEGQYIAAFQRFDKKYVMKNGSVPLRVRTGIKCQKTLEDEINTLTEQGFAPVIFEKAYRYSCKEKRK